MAQQAQVREPHYSSLSQALFPSADAWDHSSPTGTQSSQCPGRQRESAPYAQPPLLGPQKRSGSGSSTRPTTAGGVPAQAGSHQKNRLSRSSRPAAGWASASCPGPGAAAGQGRAALVMELLLEAPAGGWGFRHSAVTLRETEPPALGVEHRRAARSAPLPPTGPGVGSGGAAGPREARRAPAGGHAGVSEAAGALDGAT